MGGFHLGLVQITSSPLFGEITSRNFTQDPTGTGSETSEEVCFCVSLGLEINLGEAESNLEHPSPVHLLPVGLSAARWPLPGTCLPLSIRPSTHPSVHPSIVPVGICSVPHGTACLTPLTGVGLLILPKYGRVWKSFLWKGPSKGFRETGRGSLPQALSGALVQVREMN